MSQLKGLAAITRGISQEPPPEQINVDQAMTRKAKPPGAKAVKSRDSEYVQFKVYVRKKLKTAAARKWEDQGGRDLSDLVEELLVKYLST